MRVTIAALAATLAVSAGLLTIAGPAGATTTVPTTTAFAETAADNGPPVAAPQPGFFLRYRGHHIMGWGRNASACAYIDGIQLVLYPIGEDRYLSALQAFKEERGVRAITEASVRVLGDLDMNPPSDHVAHCPELATGAPAGN